MATLFVVTTLSLLPSASAQFVALPTFPVPGSLPYILPGSFGGPDELIYFDYLASTLNVVSYASGSPNVTWSAPAPPSGNGFIVGGDLNGDNLTDFVVATFFEMTVYHRTATGFAVVQGPVVNSNAVALASYLQLIDWDGDGDLDLIDDYTMRLNDGTGRFGTPFNLVSIPGQYVCSFAADADADGDIDFFLSSGTLLNSTSRLYIRSGSTLSPGPSWTSGQPTAARIMDVNGDGNMDLWTIVAVNNMASFTTVSLGLGNGLFGPSFTNGVPPNFPYFSTNPGTAAFLFVGFPDIDGDGTAELIAWSSTPGSTTIVDTIVYDIDASGAVTVLPYTGTTITGILIPQAANVDGDLSDDIVGYVPNPVLVQTGDLSAFVSAFAPPSHAITVTSGAGQATSVLDPTINPIVIEVIDTTTGLVAPGLTMSVTTTGGMTISAPSGLTTDTNGRIQFFVSGGTATGPQAVTVRYGNSISLPIVLSVVPPAAVSIVSGSGQAGFVNGAPLAPIVVQATRPNGSPYVGGTIAFTSNNVVTLPAGAAGVVTDGSGRASIIPTVASFGVGIVTATVGTGPSASTANASIGGRRFTIFHAPGSSILTLTYGHEDGPTPLLIVADFPRTPTVTVFGTIATSVLAPLPGLLYLDGLGYFGPPNPVIVANPSYTQLATGISPSFFGTQLVFQAYGLDSSYPFPFSVFISPAVNVTL